MKLGIISVPNQFHPYSLRDSSTFEHEEVGIEVINIAISEREMEKAIDRQTILLEHLQPKTDESAALSVWIS